MAWYEIPVDPYPDQQFSVNVVVDDENVALILRLRYNTEGDFWHMDVSDGNTGEMLISNAPLLTGEYPGADLMRQFEYVGLGSALVIKATDTADGDYPNQENLGTDYVLVWGSLEEG